MCQGYSMLLCPKERNKLKLAMGGETWWFLNPLSTDKKSSCIWVFSFGIFNHMWSLIPSEGTIMIVRKKDYPVSLSSLNTCSHIPEKTIAELHTFAFHRSTHILFNQNFLCIWLNIIFPSTLPLVFHPLFLVWKKLELSGSQCYSPLKIQTSFCLDWRYSLSLFLMEIYGKTSY